MFRRLPALGLPFVVAVLLSLAMAAAQDAAATAPATAPTTGPTSVPTTGHGPMVDNPHYLAWAKYRAGTQVQLDMNIHSGGQQMTTTVTMTLNEITPERAVVQSVAKRNVPEVPEEESHVQLHTFDAKVHQSEAERAMLPAGAEGETKEIGTENVEAAGETYETHVREFTGTVRTVPATSTQWRSDNVPGGLVKMESSTGKNTVQMILKKVTKK